MKKETARAYKGNRTLADSHINRSGLARGTTAPAFRLPLAAGGEITLDAYRGRRLMLVFSSPECAPCRLLLPELDSFHKRTPDIEILLISRGSIEAVRTELAVAPVSFPVAVQKSWEVSRRYAMFATPIGYLIDEAGLIASDVALGPEAILTLLAQAQILALLKSVKGLRKSFAKSTTSNKQPRALKRKHAVK